MDGSYTFNTLTYPTQMPILDGLAATRSIREKELKGQGLLGTAMASPAARRLPILAVTANVRDEQIAAALEAGSVRKPPSLLEAIS